MSRLLITGGTGSFGEAMIRSVLVKPLLDVDEIVVFSRDENKQHELRNSVNNKKVKFIIGDVRDKDSVDKAMVGVDIVFHAAALKQVPTGEFFPIEMVKTNILGTENVFSSAEKNGVKKVVLLTTDKAVYPINAMGMSKAIAEKIMVAKSRDKSKTVFCGVRCGNVMASRGSVVPLFYDQIKQNKKLTVTNPEMTRFLLSLDDAISLVRFAIKHGRSGDIFIKKSPATPIQFIAEGMLKVFNSNVGVQIVGTREGEKLHETLATEYELSNADDMGDYFRIPNLQMVDYENYYKKGKKIGFEGDYTSDITKQLSVKEVENLLRSLDFIKKKL